MDGIHLVSYDPAWPDAFAREASALCAVLDGRLVAEMHHVGSTAVPGLVAKPVIDILIVTPDFAAARAQCPERLDRAGYDFWADNPDPTRLFFVKGMPPRGTGRTHHLHVVEQNHSVVERHLLFRDWLRAHPEDAAAYAALKSDLAVVYAEDREAYTQAKTAFIEAVLDRARAAS